MSDLGSLIYYIGEQSCTSVSRLNNLIPISTLDLLKMTYKSSFAFQVTKCKQTREACKGNTELKVRAFTDCCTRTDDMSRKEPLQSFPKSDRFLQLC